MLSSMPIIEEIIVSVRKPHVQTVRLTREQNDLGRKRLEAERLTWQKLFSAATNAYIRGDFRVNARGEYQLAPTDSAGALAFTEEDDALGLEDLVERDIPLSEDERMIGTRQLAEKAEEITGRRVPLTLLRRLVRTRWPQEQNPGPGTRYRWHEDDPQVWEIIEAIGDGAIDALRYETYERHAEKHEK